MDDVRMLTLLVNGLFSLILMGVAYLLRGIREDLKEISREMKSFVTKEEAKPRWDRLHALGDRVIVMESKMGLHQPWSGEGG